MGSDAQGSSSHGHYVCNSHAHKPGDCGEKKAHTGTVSTSTAAIHMHAWTHKTQSKD